MGGMKEPKTIVVVDDKYIIGQIFSTVGHRAKKKGLDIDVKTARTLDEAKNLIENLPKDRKHFFILDIDLGNNTTSAPLLKYDIVQKNFILFTAAKEENIEEFNNLKLFKGKVKNKGDPSTFKAILKNIFNEIPDIVATTEKIENYGETTFPDVVHPLENSIFISVLGEKRAKEIAGEPDGYYSEFLDFSDIEKIKEWAKQFNVIQWIDEDDMLLVQSLQTYIKYIGEKNLQLKKIEPYEFDINEAIAGGLIDVITLDNLLKNITGFLTHNAPYIPERVIQEYVNVLST